MVPLPSSEMAAWEKVLSQSQSQSPPLPPVATGPSTAREMRYGFRAASSETVRCPNASCRKTTTVAVDNMRCECEDCGTVWCCNCLQVPRCRGAHVCRIEDTIDVCPFCGKLIRMGEGACKSCTAATRKTKMKMYR